MSSAGVPIETLDKDQIKTVRVLPFNSKDILQLYC